MLSEVMSEVKYPCTFRAPNLENVNTEGQTRKTQDWWFMNVARNPQVGLEENTWPEKVCVI